MIQNSDKKQQKRLKIDLKGPLVTSSEDELKANVIVPPKKSEKVYQKALRRKVDISPDTEFPETVSMFTGAGLHWTAMHEDLMKLIEVLQPIEDMKYDNSWNDAPVFDLTLVALMGRVGASPELIAGALACETKVINRELKNPESPFSLVYNKAKSQTALALLKEQLATGLAGDVQMLKWTGMQMLNQSDKLESRNVQVDERSPEERKARIHELTEIIEKIRSA